MISSTRVAYFMHTSTTEGAGLYFATLPLFLKLKRTYLMSVFSLDNSNSTGGDWGGAGQKRFPFRFLDMCFLRDVDVIHLHGIWGLHAIAAAINHMLFKTRIIITPHGMLDPWALNQSKFKKQLSFIFYLKRLLKRAEFVQALNNEEKTAILNVNAELSVKVIPNGTEIQGYKEKTISGKKKVLYLGRMNNKKGINELLSVLESSDERYYSDLEFYFAGNGDSLVIERLKALSTVRSNVKYLGSVYGEKKKALYNSCHAFFLPSFSEGLPMTVLESWSFGLVTCISEHCNLSTAKDQPFYIDTPPSLDGIKNSLDHLKLMSLNSLVLYGEQAVKYAEEHYSWDTISELFQKEIDKFV